MNHVFNNVTAFLVLRNAIIFICPSDFWYLLWDKSNICFVDKDACILKSSLAAIAMMRLIFQERFSKYLILIRKC
jgi:hypothetical protein